MHGAHASDEEDAVEYGWRRRIAAWSVPVAIAYSAIALVLVAAADGAQLWRLVGIAVFVILAIDAVRFAVQAQRHAAIRLDRVGIALFGSGRIPWTAISSCSVEANDDDALLVVVLVDGAQDIDRARWRSPRMRRYWNRVRRRRRLELDTSVLRPHQPSSPRQSNAFSQDAAARSSLADSAVPDAARPPAANHQHPRHWDTRPVRAPAAAAASGRLQFRIAASIETLRVRAIASSGPDFGG